MTVVESLQKIIFSIFAVTSFTSVSANRTATRAPMSSSRQIDSNFKGETWPFTTIRIHSTVSSVNARLSYAHTP